MATILFEEIIFGPIHSRRLGTSLGVNLLPLHGKLCSFDCLYCECGLNAQHKTGQLPTAEEVRQALETRLTELHKKGTTLDVITFAGNGEPTVHPDFARIIDDTITLRNRFFPKAKVSVLSNATQLNKPKVYSALLKVENAILKLDSAFDNTVKILDRPASSSYSIREQVERMKKFKGKLIIQTLFTRGQYEGQSFDNTSETEVSAWIVLMKEIAPESVMIYTIDRETPVSSLEKISVKELKSIAKRLKDETGLIASVAG
jgi:Fe-S oxidoreductases